MPTTKRQPTQLLQDEPASYTPVVFPEDHTKVFESSLPSLSSISGFSPALTYLEDLQKKHHALAQIVREEPASPLRPSSPSSSDGDFDEQARLAAREERIAALRSRVQEAFINAEGNPADGKWIFLTALLRMQSTSGAKGRWAGTRTDRRPAEPLEGMEWINAETETEWREWERRYVEERRVKEKVESWKRRVEPPSKGPSLLEGPGGLSVSNELDDGSTSARSQLGKATVTVKVAGASTSQQAAAGLSDPLKDSAPFGFGVVKRASQNTNNPGGKPSKFTSAGAAAGKGRDESSHRNDDQGKANADPSSLKGKEKEKDFKANTDARHIADLPDTSFNLPSFSSSQVLTSTPKPNAKPTSKSGPQAQGLLAPVPLFLPSPSPSTPPPRSVGSAAAHAQVQAPAAVNPASPSSPRVTKTYGRQNTTPRASDQGSRMPLDASASLPALPMPTTPTRQRPLSNDGVLNANNKRALPTTPTRDTSYSRQEEEDVERALKRARTLAALETPPPGMTRNRSAHHQTLIGFAEARAQGEMGGRQASPRTPRAQAQVQAGEGSAAAGLKTPTPGLASAEARTSPVQLAAAPSGPSRPFPNWEDQVQAPTTPLQSKKTAALPTLTALLASANAKKRKGSSSASSNNLNKGVRPPNSGNRAQPQHQHQGALGEAVEVVLKDVVEESEERREVAEELVPSVPAIGSGAGSAGGVFASTAVDVSIITAAAVEVRVEHEAEQGQEQEPQSGGTGSHSNSYPNAPAYAYPAVDGHLDLAQHMAGLDPHADMHADPYAEPAVHEQDSIFGDELGGGGGYDPYSDIEVDLASPAKSLSSIAGSDDEDEEEEVDQLAGDRDGEEVLGRGFKFEPFATSTQQGHFGAGSGGRGRSRSGSPLAAAAAAAAVVATDLNAPEVSQGTKDSWESVYVPKSSATGAGGAPASSTSRQAQHASSQLSSHSHSSLNRAPPSSNPFLSNGRGAGAGGALPPSSNPYGFAYNSQYESKISQGVNRANMLLDQDLEIDGWLNLKEGDEEGAEGGVEESP